MGSEPRALNCTRVISRKVLWCGVSAAENIEDELSSAIESMKFEALLRKVVLHGSMVVVRECDAVNVDEVVDVMECVADVVAVEECVSDSVGVIVVDRRSSENVADSVSVLVFETDPDAVRILLWDVEIDDSRECDGVETSVADVLKEGVSESHFVLVSECCVEAVLSDRVAVCEFESDRDALSVAEVVDVAVGLLRDNEAVAVAASLQVELSLPDHVADPLTSEAE